MVATYGLKTAAGLGAVTIGAWKTQQLASNVKARTERQTGDLGRNAVQVAPAVVGIATAGALFYSLVRAQQLGQQVTPMAKLGVAAIRIAGVAGVLGGAALAITPPGDNEAWKRVSGIGLALTGATLAMAAGTLPALNNEAWELMAWGAGKLLR